MSEDDNKTPVSRTGVSDMLNKIVQNKIDVNRRYIDEILEKVQERNRQYFLDRYNEELAAMEKEDKAGNMQKATRHQVMADVYKSIAERCFTQ